ncbi:MAG: hypothetical protein AAGF92_10040 [Myxococcota bacterium]
MKRLFACVALGLLLCGGCGDDESGEGGTAGGAGATGGEPARGEPVDTCDAFCATTCPDINGISLAIFSFEDCIVQCSESQFGNDGCGPEAEAFVVCLESVDCDESRFVDECKSPQAGFLACVEEAGGGF